MSANRILIALQYWSGDAEAAYELAGMMADNEPEKRLDVDILLARRRGCPEPKKELLDTLREKFNVFTFMSAGRGSGYPWGCNELWVETMQWAYQYEKATGKTWDCVLTCEGDCVFTSKDWIDRLKAVWDDTKWSVGNLNELPSVHINGNALFCVDILEKTKFYGCCTHVGWDMAIASKLVPNSSDTEEIINIYNTKTMEAKDFKALRKGETFPAFVHGVKDNSARKIVKKMLTL